jgi:hypothetical protein
MLALHVIYDADKFCRTTNEDLTNLVDWAVTGHDRTTNQRFRPALIIVINNDDRNDVEQWCDVDYATDALKHNIENSTLFEDQRKTWTNRGRNLETPIDLFNCYYDEFRVVSIPSLKAAPSRIIMDQYQKLYSEIKESLDRVQNRRRISGMRSDVETLTLYMEIAFKELSKNLEGTVDFYEIIRQVTHLPQTFSDRFTSLLAKMNDHHRGSEDGLLRSVSPYVGAALTLESAFASDGRCTVFSLSNVVLTKY